MTTNWASLSKTTFWLILSFELNSYACHKAFYRAPRAGEPQSHGQIEALRAACTPRLPKGTPAPAAACTGSTNSRFHFEAGEQQRTDVAQEGQGQCCIARSQSCVSAQQLSWPDCGLCQVVFYVCTLVTSSSLVDVTKIPSLHLQLRCGSLQSRTAWLRHCWFLASLGWISLLLLIHSAPSWYL